MKLSWAQTRGKVHGARRHRNRRKSAARPPFTNDAETLQAFADASVATEAAITSDGHAGYNETSLGDRDHAMIVKTPAERRVKGSLQTIHWTVLLLKRWLLGTHACAGKPRYLRAYLDELAFRWNSRRTNGVGHIAARTIGNLVGHAPPTLRAIKARARPYQHFVAAKPAVPELRA
jgi:hypothetical protein